MNVKHDNKLAGRLALAMAGVLADDVCETEVQAASVQEASRRTLRVLGEMMGDADTFLRPMASERNQRSASDSRLSWFGCFNYIEGVFTADDFAKRIDKEHDGIALTSMPDDAKATLKRELKARGYKVVQVDSPSLALVVFGDGQQASTKTRKVRERLDAGEDIHGMYYRDLMDWLLL